MLVVSASGDIGMYSNIFAWRFFFYFLSVILLSLIVELLGYECEGIMIMVQLDSLDHSHSFVFLLSLARLSMIMSRLSNIFFFLCVSLDITSCVGWKLGGRG